MFKILLEVKDTILQSDFYKTFITIGCIAFAACLLYQGGKVVGCLIASFVK